MDATAWMAVSTVVLPTVGAILGYLASKRKAVVDQQESFTAKLMAERDKLQAVIDELHAGMRTLLDEKLELVKSFEALRMEYADMKIESSNQKEAIRDMTVEIRLLTAKLLEEEKAAVTAREVLVSESEQAALAGTRAASAAPEPQPESTLVNVAPVGKTGKEQLMSLTPIEQEAKP